jgi:hypothetical protein
VGDPLGGRLVDREADALEPAAVHEHDARLVLGACRLWPNRVAVPHRLELISAAEHEAHPSEQSLLGKKGSRAAGCVARRLDSDRERRDVTSEHVQRALHLLRRGRAGVVAVRV